MPLIDPVLGTPANVPDLAGFGYSEFPSSQPFSQRSASGYQESLEGVLRHLYRLNRYLAETNQQNVWDANVAALIQAVEAALQQQSNSNAQAIADAFNLLIEQSIIITDPAILVVLQSATTGTRAWLDSHYVKNSPGDIDAAISPVVTDPGGNTRKNLDRVYMSDDAKRMNGKQLWTFGDSFTQPIYAQVPWPIDLAADRTMTLNNKGVSSSMMRDTAMRMIRDRSNVVGSDFAVINCGINAAVRYNTDGKIRASEMAALQTAILLLSSDRLIEADASTNIINPINGFATYPTPAFSASGGASTDQPGKSVTWPNLPFGGYFGVGFTFRVGAGGQNDIKGSTGKWTIGNTTVLEARNDQPSPTALEINSDPQSSLNFVPWPAMFPVVGPGQAIKVESVATGDITTVDAIYHVMQAPPTIVIILPTRVTASSGYAVSDDTLRVVRGDALRAIAELTQKYTQLRGRVYAVNPDDFGWNADQHTVSDGLHPNNEGHHLLADAVQRTVARGDLIGPFMSAFGVAGPNVSYPVVWPTY